MMTSQAEVVPELVAPVTSTHPTAAPTASLYVGELHPDVTEAMLYEIFSQIGPVSSIRICRDAITRRSLGYSYVNFHSTADGERALETLNYSLIKGHPCRIMWSQRDPSLRRSGHGNVFIKNLDKSIDNKALHDTFSAFGNILSCKVVCDDLGNSKGYGFVHFETQEAADEAIAKVNGMLLNDVKVFVGRHQSRRERLQVMEHVKSQFTNVFVKNLDESVTDEQLRTLFSKYGNILSAVVQRDEKTGDSLGFGFVNFETHEQAQKACDELNGKIFTGGKELYVGRAQKKAERSEELRRQFEALKLERLNKLHGNNVYVKNLAETVDDERLRIEFSAFGSITSCKVMCDDKGITRGFGFVCFATPEEAGRAITDMNGRMLLGKPLYVSLAQRKDERRSQLEAQFSARAQQLRFQQQQQAAIMGMAPPTGGAIFQQGPMFYGNPYAAPRFHHGQRPPFMPRPPMAGVRPMMPRTPYRPNPAVGGAPGGGFVAAAAPGVPMPRRPYIPSAAGGSRYAPGPRNQQQQGPMMYANPSRPAYVPRPLTMVALAAVPVEQQKRMLGERLYPLVHEVAPEQASKITGMLLEMDNGDVLHLLESQEALVAKVEEAHDVLRKHHQQQSQQIQA